MYSVCIPRSETYQHFLFAYKIQFLIKSTLFLMMCTYVVALKRDMMAISYHIHSTIFWMMEFEFFVCLLVLFHAYQPSSGSTDSFRSFFSYIALSPTTQLTKVNPQYRSKSSYINLFSSAAFNFIITLSCQKQF